MRFSETLLLLSVLLTNCGGLVSEADGSDAGASLHDAYEPYERKTIVRDAEVEERLSAKPDGNGCTTEQRNAIWAKMLAQPIVPGQSAALLELKAFPTRKEAESVLCQGHDLGPARDGGRVEGWGNQNEVQLTYDEVTGTGKILTVYLRYAGSCDFMSDPAFPPVTAYSAAVGREIVTPTDGGWGVAIDWSDPDFRVGTAVYNALLYTFGRTLGTYTGPVKNCAPSLCPVATATIASGHVRVLSMGVAAATPSGIPLALVFDDNIPLNPNVSTLAAVDMLPRFSSP